MAETRLLHYAPPEARIPPDLAGERIIRPGVLATILGVATPTVYRMIQAGRLPRPRRFSHRVAGWRAADILPLLRGEGGANPGPSNDAA